MEGRDQDLLDALRRLSEEKKQARVTHAYRVVKRFGLPIRTKAEVDRFLAWMNVEGLAASTKSTIVSFNRREVNAFRQMEEALMRKTRLTRSGCYKVAMEDLYLKHFPRR